MEAIIFVLSCIIAGLVSYIHRKRRYVDCIINGAMMEEEMSLTTKYGHKKYFFMITYKVNGDTIGKQIEVSYEVYQRHKFSILC